MIKAAIRKILVATMSYKILQWRRKDRLIILMYHGFYDENQSEGLEQYAGRWCEINTFKAQIAYLKRHYNIISIDLLHQFWSKGVSLPDHSVIITMDDGYESNYSLAYPYLKQQNVPFTIFVSTDFIDDVETLWADRLDYALWKYAGQSVTLDLGNGRVITYSTANDTFKAETAIALRDELQSLNVEDRKNIITQIEQKEGLQTLSKEISTKLQTPLSWDQIRELSRDPLVSIGSHSVTHPNLTTCTDEQLEFELSESKHRIEKQIGADFFCPVFCYPGGAHDKRVETSVERAGYSSALAIGQKSMAKNFHDRYNIQRLGINRELKLDEIILRLCIR